MKRLFSLFIFTGIFFGLYAQSYLEKQSRHRFAQLAMGADARFIFPGGEAQFLDENGQLQNYQPGNIIESRLTISGLHFWGFAEFYVSFPLRSFQVGNQPAGVRYNYQTGVETGGRFYPIRIQHGKLSPYIGTSFNPLHFRQRSEWQERAGTDLNHTTAPLHAGLVYTHRSLMFETGLSYFAPGNRTYYASRDQSFTFRRPPLTLSLGFKWFIDTTVGSERSYENGQTEKQVKAMAEKGALNGLSFAIGPSSAFTTNRSSYNLEERPFLDDHHWTNVFPELGIGYYWHKPDLHLNLVWRNTKSTMTAYGIEQTLQRNAFSLEAYKFLFDYHGFVPYIGPSIGLENLSAVETDNGQMVLDLQRQTVVPGITFGWDIRPDRLQPWLLRTNLRYTPFLTLDTGDGNQLNFSQVEFNFIEFVYYPGRAKRIKAYR